MAGQSDGWITTARVLRRTGFGTTGRQVDAVAAQGWPKYVDAALAADPDKDPGAVATPMPRSSILRGPGKGASVADRKQFNQQLTGQMTELSQWWLRRMVAVQQPLHEKLTLLWHNHFATSAEKVRFAAYMGAQNQKLRSMSLGDFRTLAYSMLTDAAMMHWLDAQTSTAKAPNENLAREFMELFTLGHGNGYSEDDVRQGARALTGWVIRPLSGQTMVVPKRQDRTAKTIFGVSKNFDAAGFCDAVLAQQKSPEFVAGRLWQQLASDNPPSPPAMDRLVSAYGPRRDLRGLTRAILTEDEFVNSRAAIVNTPVEWVVGIIRTLQVPLDNPKQLKMVNTTLHALGQRPFYPPDVGGWPHGRVWMSTASADVRMRAASQLARAGDLSAVTDAAADERIDAVGYLIGVGAWSDRTVKALQPLVSRPVQLVAAAVNTPEYLTS
jgi:uncharacterized protein (DUF1800 family)